MVGLNPSHAPSCSVRHEFGPIYEPDRFYPQTFGAPVLSEPDPAEEPNISAAAAEEIRLEEELWLELEEQLELERLARDFEGLHSLDVSEMCGGYEPPEPDAVAESKGNRSQKHRRLRDARRSPWNEDPLPFENEG